MPSVAAAVTARTILTLRQKRRHVDESPRQAGRDWQKPALEATVYLSALSPCRGVVGASQLLQSLFLLLLLRLGSDNVRLFQAANGFWLARSPSCAVDRDGACWKNVPSFLYLFFQPCYENVIATRYIQLPKARVAS